MGQEMWELLLSMGTKRRVHLKGLGQRKALHIQNGRKADRAGMKQEEKVGGSEAENPSKGQIRQDKVQALDFEWCAKLLMISHGLQPFVNEGRSQGRNKWKYLS